MELERYELKENGCFEITDKKSRFYFTSSNKDYEEDLRDIIFRNMHIIKNMFPIPSPKNLIPIIRELNNIDIFALDDNAIPYLIEVKRGISNTQIRREVLSQVLDYGNIFQRCYGDFKTLCDVLKKNNINIDSLLSLNGINNKKEYEILFNRNLYNLKYRHVIISDYIPEDLINLAEFSIGRGSNPYQLTLIELCFFDKKSTVYPISRWSSSAIFMENATNQDRNRREQTPWKIKIQSLRSDLKKKWEDILSKLLSDGICKIRGNAENTPFISILDNQNSATGIYVYSDDLEKGGIALEWIVPKNKHNNSKLKEEKKFKDFLKKFNLSNISIAWASTEQSDYMRAIIPAEDILIKSNDDIFQMISAYIKTNI